MKTKLIIFSVILFSVFFGSAQDKESKLPKLIREEMNSGYKYIYMDQNWKLERSRNFNLQALGYDLIGMDIDTAIVFPLCRKVISSKHYDQLNKEIWRINTVVNPSGQIKAVEFWFKNESGVNPDEFAQLAELIKSNVKWKLYFNKEVKDMFYMEFNFPGPKFQD